jgi:hypothetical protein
MTKKLYTKGDSDDENAPCHQDSYNSEDEKEGGKSQDQYESDFINDDKTEERTLKINRQAAKGHVTSEEDVSYANDTC